MPTSEPSSRAEALALLRQAVGNTSASFRDGQWESINALVSARRRLLVVERTGWGKSSVYFIATRLLRDRGHGPTLIVSPLLALMRNQIDSAQRHGVQAVRIDSTNRADWDEIEARVRGGHVDALLVSPERLANDAFVDGVLMPIASLRTLGLVPDFAERLAKRLNVPFCKVVAKVRPNEPQKDQQNRYHQCHNLDGAFKVVGDVPSGPALLLDDVVDSGWTLAVVAALLRQAGSGPVYPVALANSAPGG